MVRYTLTICKHNQKDHGTKRPAEEDDESGQSNNDIHYSGEYVE
jgi:hypothetical protein